VGSRRRRGGTLGSLLPHTLLSYVLDVVAPAVEVELLDQVDDENMMVKSRPIEALVVARLARDQRHRRAGRSP